VQAAVISLLFRVPVSDFIINCGDGFRTLFCTETGRESFCGKFRAMDIDFCGAPIIIIDAWGISTVGSALHSHCRGHGFESRMLHTSGNPYFIRVSVFLCSEREAIYRPEKPDWCRNGAENFKNIFFTVQSSSGSP
jgi:hypothetical protein